jgi:WD40 repeat protein/serine/threonine protein kinase
MGPESNSQSDREKRLDEVILSYLKEVDAGQEPDEHKILDGHHDLADDLARFFANRRRLNPFNTTLLPPVPPEPPAEIDLPSFGDYEVLGKIPGAGMSVVYRARQKSLKRLVALKMILPDRAESPADVQRIIQEAEDVARLDHPNIVPIYEVNSHEGKPYFSMKFMEGGSLASRIDDFRLPRVDRKTRKDEQERVWTSSQIRKRQREIAGLVATIARTVHHAHQRGILHRDLKPGNVLLDAEGKPHVTDFGLAKRFEPGCAGQLRERGVKKNEVPGKDRDGIATEAHLPATNSTASYLAPEVAALSVGEMPGVVASGRVAGTAPYMAPEQARATKVLTTAVDVYGLGAILYELMTGRPPFQANTPLETLLEVIEKEVVLPRALNTRVNRDLEAVCLKCLAKAPQERYTSAEGLAEDLERWQRGDPIVARPSKTLERATKWVRRRPAVAVLTFAVTLLSVLALGGILWQWRKTAEHEEIQERQLYAVHITQARDYLSSGQLDLAEDALDQCPSHLRQWEWRLLRGLCARETIVLRGHKSTVNSVQFHPDGDRVVTASHDGTAMIWDVATGAPLHTLVGHQGWAHNWVNNACFGCKGRYVFTAELDPKFGQGVDLKVKIWNTETGELLRDLSGEGDLVTAGIMSDLVATRAKLGGEITVWRVGAARDELVYRANRYGPGEAISIALSQDGRYLAVAGNRNLLQVHDLQNPGAVRDYTIEEKGMGNYDIMWSVAFSPDGERLAAGSAFLGEWTVADGKLVNRFSTGDITGLSIAYSSQEDRLAATDRTGLIRIWDRSTGKSFLGPKNRKGGVPYLAFHPTDPHRLAVVRGRVVTIQNISPTSIPTHDILQVPETRIFAELAFNPSGEFLVARGGKRDLIRWDLSTNKPVKFQSPGVDLTAQANLTIIPGERPLLVCGCGADKPLAWDFMTGRTTEVLPIFVADTRCSASSADGRLLALTDKQNQIHLWDVHEAKERGVWHGGPRRICALAFQPGERSRLCAGSVEGTVRLWDTADGKELWKANDHIRVVTHIAFSPDGRQLATASGDATVRLWDSGSGKLMGTLSGHSGYVSCVCYSPDGRRIASSGYDGTVKLWDADSGLEVLSLRDHTSFVTCVAFSPDGARLASCAGDGTVRVWHARSREDPTFP